MKPIPAIVELAQVDVDAAAEHIIVALAGERDAVRSAERHEQLGSAARETSKVRRLEVGRWLNKVRPTWPASGPKARGWSEFLVRVKLDDSTAVRYMNDAKVGVVHGEPSGKGSPQDSAHDRELSQTTDDDEPADVLGQQRNTPPFRQQTRDDLIQALGRLSPEDRKFVLKATRANVKGGSGEEDRGTWCTSKEWAAAVGPWELDPFSNPRSHIASVTRCMLEDGGDAFGGGPPGGARPGLYLAGNAHGAQPTSGVADELTRVWIQPPYELVAEAIAHYGHTRFCALLRWSPDVKAWFPQLWERTAVVCHPWCERMEFEPPPGVPSSGDMPYPHALYYAHEADVTDEVRARCIVWRVDHDLDPRGERPALQLVR